MQFILSHLEDHFMGKLGVSKGEHSSKISEHKFLFFEFADHIEELTINCSLVFFPLFSNCVNLFLGVKDVSLSMFWLIQLMAKFTVESLQMWQFAPNSIHYLLSLWQRMVASVPYVKATEPHLLETYTPEVTHAYITSRLDSVAVVVRDGLEDPLEDLGMVGQQLDQLSVIGRCEYSKTCQLLVQLFDTYAREYQELCSNQ